jgi:cbb3-type cytochrome oxidase maturation protein
MSVIYLVLPVALVIVAGAVIAFVWAAKRGQFDDLDTPAVRMLHDDTPDGETERGRAPVDRLRPNG